MNTAKKIEFQFCSTGCSFKETANDNGVSIDGTDWAAARARLLSYVKAHLPKGSTQDPEDVVQDALLFILEQAS
jgi:hypothetical protein